MLMSILHMICTEHSICIVFSDYSHLQWRKWVQGSTYYPADYEAYYDEPFQHCTGAVFDACTSFPGLLFCA